MEQENNQHASALLELDIGSRKSGLAGFKEIRRGNGARDTRASVNGETTS